MLQPFIALYSVTLCICVFVVFAPRGFPWACIVLSPCVYLSMVAVAFRRDIIMSPIVHMSYNVGMGLVCILAVRDELVLGIAHLAIVPLFMCSTKCSPAAAGDDAQSECVICIGPMSEASSVKFPCTHAFHISCAEEWLELHTTCPICRRDVRILYDGDLTNASS